MSAGGLSYSCLTSYGRATLPSVEAGLGSVNVIKDPPKSIMTRRKDKVGQTIDINQLIEDSGDRTCEAISIYARGVNPMVSVDYGNHGNSGGQRSGGITSNIHGGQAYLPYRIMPGGAFRPPIVSPEQLLPLSRQRRANTSAYTKKGFVDYRHKLRVQGKEKKHIKEKILTTSVRPTETFIIEKPIPEPSDVKFSIKEKIKFNSHAGVSGTKTLTQVKRAVKRPKRQIKESLKIKARVNKNGHKKYANQSKYDVGKYIQSTLNSNVETFKSGYNKTNYIHKDIQLSKKMIGQTHTAVKSSNIYKGITSRNYKLRPTINAGGMTGRATMPKVVRENNIKDVMPDKAIMSRKIHEMQMGR